MNPVWHVGGPVGGGVVGFGIEPFSERGLDEALGLAVGPWGVGPRRDVAGADGLEGVLEEAAVCVGEGIVAHDALDAHAAGGEPAGGAGHKAGAGFAGLTGQDFGVGEPRGIVDGDVQIFPAAAALAPAAVTGHAVAGAVDAAELLGVDVDDLARMFALVADHGRARIEGPQAAEAETAQHETDGGQGHTGGSRDARARPARPPQALDLGHRFSSQAMRTMAGRRAPVTQGRLAARPVAGQPLVGGAHRHRTGLGGLGHRPALLADAVDQLESTKPCHTGILVNVHPGLLAETDCRNNNSLTSLG